MSVLALDPSLGLRAKPAPVTLWSPLLLNLPLDLACPTPLFCAIKVYLGGGVAEINILGCVHLLKVSPLLAHHHHH